MLRERSFGGSKTKMEEKKSLVGNIMEDAVNKDIWTIC